MFRAFAGPWWVLLVTGILWFLISLIVLRFDLASLAAVGTLLGVVLLIASLNEFFVASVRGVGDGSTRWWWRSRCDGRAGDGPGRRPRKSRAEQATILGG
jgi:hypothetical protein